MRLVVLLLSSLHVQQYQVLFSGFERLLLLLKGFYSAHLPLTALLTDTAVTFYIFFLTEG